MTSAPRAALSLFALLCGTACLSISVQPASAGGVGGRSSGGNTSGQSNSSGGATGSGTTGGACLANETSLQLDPCGDAGECGCPLDCARDPLAAAIFPEGRVCEAPCRTDADCAILTACVGGICSLVACGADAGNGTYAFGCAMGDEGGLGSCFVGAVDGGRFSLCVAGGDAGSSCDPTAAERAIPSSLCPPGYLCYAPPDSNQGACEKLCDDVATFCPAGQTCAIEFIAAPKYGHCVG